MSLPTMPKSPQMTPQATLEPDATALATRQVLVIEDDRTVGRALSILLRQAGYHAKVFADGHSALKYTQGPMDATPAAVVVDIHLPDISGLLVSQKLRQSIGQEIPIIVLSGDTSMENLNSLRHVGATYFFSKPVNATHLIQRLRELNV